MAEGRLKEAQHEFELEAREGGQQAGLAVVYFALGRATDSQAALGRFIHEYGPIIRSTERRSTPMSETRSTPLSGSSVPVTR